jgi:hypothetical protein
MGVVKLSQWGLGFGPRYYLRASKVMDANSGPTGDSKVRWRSARPTRDQGDFHHHVRTFREMQMISLEDREQDRAHRWIEVSRTYDRIRGGGSHRRNLHGAADRKRFL